MQQAVRKYLLALEAGDADKAAALFVPEGGCSRHFSAACRCATT